MIASGSSRDGLETEFGLRAAADVKNTGGEAFTGFAAGHFFACSAGWKASTAKEDGNFFHNFCKQMKTALHLSIAAGLQCEGVAPAWL
jgi:hypothetical protein